MIKKTSDIKSKNTNTSETNEPKIQTRVIDDYYCVLSWKRKPITKSAVDAFFDRATKWVRNDEKLTGKDEPFRLDQLLNKEGIPKDTYYKWVKNYPEHAVAHKYILTELARAREYGAWTRKYDPCSVYKTQAVYCDDFKSEQERTALLKLDGAGNNSQPIFNVVLPQAESTGKVKSRIKKTEIAE